MLSIYEKEYDNTKCCQCGFKNAVSIELTAFLAFFVFCEQANIRLPKNPWFFGKRKNICSIFTKLCFVLYEICFDEVQQSSQENEIQNLSQQPTAHFTVQRSLRHF